MFGRIKREEEPAGNTFNFDWETGDQWRKGQIFTARVSDHCTAEQRAREAAGSRVIPDIMHLEGEMLVNKKKRMGEACLFGIKIGRGVVQLARPRGCTPCYLSWLNRLSPGLFVLPLKGRKQGK